jgi:outer membrane protein assembly factor BamD
MVVGIVLLTGCHSQGSKKFKPSIDPELLNLSKEEIFDRAEKLFEGKKYTKARSYYSNVYENFPNDPLGRRSLLRVADSYFKQGDPVNLVEAQYKYRDFLNRYPGSEFADYAMLQIANVSHKQMERPDRDQVKTREAIDKYKEMLTAYPNSSLRPEAEEKMQGALDRLAKHEHIVARFYMKRHNYIAAVTRLNQIVDQYPRYNERDAMFYDLAASLEGSGRKNEARLYYERVVSEFPNSDYAKRAKSKLGSASS